MSEVTEYVPDDYLIGTPVTTRATIKTGETFPARTPLMFDATDTAALVKWDGTPGKAVAMSARNVTDTGSDQLSTIYTQGGFRIGFVNWPDTVITEKAKRAAFLGSAVYVDDEY
ncbi:head decoration protein [Photobacterium sp. MCCC 1A19761]|uniref:head decoration protein n=1 Tax=Photobacterium sp. MCCC 1A19761 TaxID=3115000 RepID=UPI00307D786B